jgi:LysM repeat protein
MATYRVKSGDNLWKIAENLFGDGRAMKRIMYLNGMQSTTIRPGMTLKLPTIIKGRNDQFFIGNAEANTYGLASEQQIASGQYGGGVPYLQQGAPNLTQQQPGAKDVTSTEPAKPTAASLGIGVAGMSPQDLTAGIQSQTPKEKRAALTDYGIGVAGVSGTDMQTAINKQTPIATPFNAKSYIQANQADISHALSFAKGAASEQANMINPNNIAANPETKNTPGFFGRVFNEVIRDIKMTFGYIGETTAQAYLSDLGPNNPGAVIAAESALVASGVIPPPSDPDKMLNQVGLQKPPGLPHAEAYGMAYNTRMLLAAENGTKVAAIPTLAANQPTFQFTPTQLGEMGYAIDDTGYTWRLKDPTTASVPDWATNNDYNPYTGRSYGPNYGKPGPGGPPVGGGGGGGGGNKAQGNSTSTVLKGAGSWKGINFG